MKSVLICLVLALAPAVASAQKIVILVRHAERADGGSMAPGAEKDPSLSAAGVARAETLAAMLADSGVRAVFATEFKRTQETAKPLTTRLGLTTQIVPGDDTEVLVGRLTRSHANDVVVVVGHSNTLPAVLKALGGPALTIPESEYDNLYVFIPASRTLMRLHFGVPTK
jgi:broad specificity phosphatase PhoE